MTETILNLIKAALQALAPEAASAITGGQSPEEAIASARSALDRLPDRLGTDGAWAKDLRKRTDDLPED